MIKCVVFDLGGTLFLKKDAFQNGEKEMWKEMNRRGYDISRKEFKRVNRKASNRFWEKYIEKNKDFEIGDFPKTFSKVWDKELKEEDFEALDEAFLEGFIENNDLISGAEEVLEFCKRESLELGIVTNASRIITDKRLNSSGLRDFFDVIVHPMNAKARKDCDKPFKDFLKKSGFKGKECLMIGNRLDHDIRAKKLGMKTVLFKKYQKKAQGQKFEPDYVIDELPELKDIIKNLPDNS